MGKKFDATKDQLVLRCWIEKPSYGYAHVRFVPLVRKGQTGKLEGLGFDESFGGVFLKDFRISDQIDERNRTSEDALDYAWEVTFECSHVRLGDAKGMVKTLTMVDKAMDHMREQFGYVKSYGEFVARAANAIGAVGVVFESRRYPTETQEYTPGSAVDRVNEEVDKLSRQLRGLPTKEQEEEEKRQAEAAAAATAA